MSKTLDAREKAFVDAYLLSGDAKAAALKAGYSATMANSKAYQWVRSSKAKPHVYAAIAAKAQKRAERMEVTAERIIQENARIALFDMRKLYDEDGRRIPIHKLDDDTAAAIVGYEDTLVGTKLKIADKGAALEKAFKHLGLYQLDNEQSAAKAVVMFAEMRALVAANPLSRQQPVLNPPEQHIHQ